MDKLPSKKPAKKSVKSTDISLKKTSVSQRSRANSKVASKAPKNSGEQTHGKTKRAMTSNSTKLEIIQLNENNKIMHCAACGGNRSFIYDHKSWYCNECGRDGYAAERFLKSDGYKSIPSNSEYIGNYEIDKPAAGYFWELNVKLALLVFFFPFSLLFLVIFYGFDGAARIVKELFKDALIYVFKLAFVALCLIIALVMIFHK